MAEKWLSLTVSDDGKCAETWKPGVGMSSMRERAEEVGGTVQIEPGKAGTRVVARLPVGIVTGRR